MESNAEAILLGKRIKRALDESNKDVPALAKHMNTTVQTVYRWLRGEVEPSLANLRKIGAFVDKPVEFFVAAPGTLYRYKTEGSTLPAVLVVSRNGDELVRVKLDQDTRVELRLSGE